VIPSNTQPSRRHFLRGLGTALALPAFDSFLPAGAQAASSGAKEPLKTAFFYLPNGVVVDKWKPTGAGRKFQLGPTMTGLESYRDDFQIVGNLEQEAGWAGKDGGGDHARALGTWMTGQRIRKTSGSDIKSGVSVDQVMAQRIGGQTRLPYSGHLSGFLTGKTTLHVLTILIYGASTTWKEWNYGQ